MVPRVAQGKRDSDLNDAVVAVCPVMVKSASMVYPSAAILPNQTPRFK